MTPATDFLASLQHAFGEATAGVIALPLLLLPFIAAEQIRPLGPRPGWRDYGLNILISASTAYLALPLGVAAGIWSARLRELLPWQPVAFSFDGLGALPAIGPGLEIAALILIPLLVHDAWFYWSHRLEHRLPVLWAFHTLHHSDERMNASTFGRDHFLQTSWRAFFPVFTLGLIFDLDAVQTGKAALYSTLFLLTLSMLYHSSLRLRLRWLDRVLVTPQVHRIHHSTDPRHHELNFADVFPLFDILFGTYHRPGRDEFPETGLGSQSPAPRGLWQAQGQPLVDAFRVLRSNTMRRDGS